MKCFVRMCDMSTLAIVFKLGFACYPQPEVLKLLRLTLDPKTLNALLLHVWPQGLMYVSLVLKDMRAWLHIGPKKVLTSCKTSISTRLVPPPPFLCSFMKTEFPVSRTNPTHFGAGAHCRSTKVLTPGASWWVCLALVSCHLLEQQSVMCWLGIWPTWQKVFFRATTTVESCCKANVP